MKKTGIVTTILMLSMIISIQNSTVTKAQESADIIIEVFTNKTTFGIKETIPIHINVTNPTYSAVTLRFTSSCQFNYVIRDVFSHMIYMWADGKVFLQVCTQIRNLSKKSYIANFTHTSSDLLLWPGRYSIRGIVVGYGHDVTSVWVEPVLLITIGILAVAVVVIPASALIRRRRKKMIEKTTQTTDSIFIPPII